MPASTAKGLLGADTQNALERARALPTEELLARIDGSGLRGRGGAGHSLAGKLRAVRRGAEATGRAPIVIVNAYDANPGSPLSRTLIARSAGEVLRGMAIAAHALGATEAIVYLHPEAQETRTTVERALPRHTDGLKVDIAQGPGTFMGGEESALLNVLESKRAMARQRPPYPAEQGYQLRPTLVSSAETLAWLPRIVTEGAAADTKLVSVTGAVASAGVYEVTLGTTLGQVLERAGGARSLKAIHVGGPTGGILAAARSDTRFDFDDLKAAGTHMGSAQVRAIANDTCIVREAGKLFAYLAKETCAICVPCRVGTKRVQGILDGVTSSLGRESDLAWLDELGTHMEKFSLCGFGITAPSILRTTMREFADEYRAHIVDRTCPTGTCTTLRSRRYETMVQP